MQLNEFLGISFLGNTVMEYVIAAGVFIAIVLAITVFKKYILYLIKKIAQKTKTELDDLIINIIESVHYPFFLALALFVAMHFLETGKQIMDLAYFILLLGTIYYSVKILNTIIDFLVKEYNKKNNGKEKGTPRALDYLARFSKAVLWFLALLLLLSNLGFDVTALMAGFGIAGLAIAFALQNILSDVFYFFSIYFDKPFVEGDFLIIGDDLGTVEKIGLKSTRLKTLRGEELVMSNNELINSRIHNFKKMHYRRIQFGFGVVYDTTIKKMNKIPEIVKNAVASVPKTRLDRVHFKEFGDFSLNYEIVYFLDTDDYNIYMDAQQKINLEIKKEFEKEKIDFAFPTYKIVK